MKIRTLIQALSLALFLYLLWLTAFPLTQSIIPLDLYLRLDPLIATHIPLVTKSFITSLVAGLFVLGITLIFGRIFCGYICPMGISLDIGRKIFSFLTSIQRVEIKTSYKQLKYLILIAFLLSAFFSVNIIFWGSPIALVTRFYSLVLHPFVTLVGNTGLTLFRPLFEELGMLNLAYSQVQIRVFHTIYFVAFFFVFLFILERIRPRFYCSYLCPAGALLALFSLKPLWKRHVDNSCIKCGKCAKNCPTSAISPKGENHGIETDYKECITCRACVKVCPTQSVSFTFLQKQELKEEACSPSLPSRRAFLGAGLSGSVLAMLSTLSGASVLSPTSSSARYSRAQLGCVRPPAALPEHEFLDRCVRCGQCMKACPTNALQPSWLIAGVEGIFSPVLMSRIGPCEPECNACGAVCPSQAILKLPIEDKKLAKIGTAVVSQNYCLAWAEGRSCVVCQEVCPYGAIEIKTQNNSKVPVPTVIANRCFGCGFCERHCPVRIPAINIEPLNALRLSTNTYAKAAKAAGLDIVPVSQRINAHQIPSFIPENELPPGFID